MGRCCIFTHWTYGTLINIILCTHTPLYTCLGDTITPFWHHNSAQLESPWWIQMATNSKFSPKTDLWRFQWQHKSLLHLTVWTPTAPLLLQTSQVGVGWKYTHINVKLSNSRICVRQAPCHLIHNHSETLLLLRRTKLCLQVQQTGVNHVMILDACCNPSRLASSFIYTRTFGRQGGLSCVNHMQLSTACIFFDNASQTVMHILHTQHTHPLVNANACFLTPFLFLQHTRGLVSACRVKLQGCRMSSRPWWRCWTHYRKPLFSYFPDLVFPDPVDTYLNHCFPGQAISRPLSQLCVRFVSRQDPAGSFRAIETISIR